MMLYAQFIVIQVVRRCYFLATGTKLHIDIFIEDNRYFLIDKRYKSGFTMQMFIPFIIRVDTNCCIRHDGFRPGSSYCKSEESADCSDF